MAKFEQDIGPAEPASVLKMLAYYDVRGVSNEKLKVIFRCTVADLDNARLSEEYQDSLSAEEAQFQSARAELDDNWDHLERKTLGALIDSVDTSSDPRFLLGAAVQANKAARRNKNSASTPEKSIIDVTPASGARVTVVRLRSSFLQVMQDEKGARAIARREAEIVTSNTENLREDMTPREVQALLRDSLGIDPTDVTEINRSGNTEDMTFDFDYQNQSEFIKKITGE